jgi:CRP/FNR family transcriptional regulator, cyclic AMP receptor protein
MVSPELLRKYAFFAGLNDSQLKNIAMIAEEVSYVKGEQIFEECDDANALYILKNGSVDLYYRSEEEFHPKTRKEFHVGEINPGEAFAVSALLEPYSLNATARAAQDSTTIKVDAVQLRQLMINDAVLGYTLMAHTAKTLMERLGAARVQLAAAWAE